MSNVPGLQTLANNRDALLLAEVAAWLHDIGKFCNLHIEAHANGGTRKWANDHAYKVIVDNPATQIRLDCSTKKPDAKKPDALKNILNAGSPKAADFLDNRLKDFLTNTSLTILGETYTLAELIMLGTPGFATAPNRSNLLYGKPGWLPAVLGVCHNEAHVDKQDPAKGEGMQTWPNVYISSAFGFEEEKVIVDNSPNSLDARLKNLQVPPRRESLLNELVYGLGDTRQPVNEVLLSDWAWIVAALFKSALAEALVKNQQFTIRQWKSWKDKIIEHDLRWRVLRVNFDVLGLYAKAIKIADLLAYQKKVEEACAAVKSLVEDEYPLGNEVYRDSSSIYFTFPDLDLPADLAQEIRQRVEAIEPELAPHIAVTTGGGATAQEQLKSILGKARGEAIEALKYPFYADNLSSHWGQEWDKHRDEKEWGICPLCRLRPKRERDEVCEHCDRRRKSRLQTWQKNLRQTIWLGEIADHNNRVALLVGKFELDGWLSGNLVQTMLVKAVENNSNGCVPKNPSPARLRRIWETCQRFWTETVEGEIFHEKLTPHVRKLIVPNKTNWQEGLYNGKVNGKPIDLFWQPERNAFLTVSNLQAAGELKYGDTITLMDPDSKTDAGSFAVQKVEDTSDSFAQYQPWLFLLASPDQFLVFLPAAAALDIARQIKSEYEKQFGKVRNRLPMALGVVYFERKMPLMAVMDSARQMLKQPVISEQWTVSRADGSGHIEFENGIVWNVPTVMGDGQTLDVWYPYWRVEGKPSGRARWFIGPDGEHWVHVNNLNNGDTVTLTPSTFDFLWLDTAARRFEVHYEKGRRSARPTRPYYLEDLDRLEQVWRAFSQLSRTQMKQTLQTLETARERWFGADGLQASASNETFRQFAEDTLANAQWRWKDIPKEQKEQLIQAAVRGELTDWAELHLEILKEKA